MLTIENIKYHCLEDVIVFLVKSSMRNSKPNSCSYHKYFHFKTVLYSYVETQNVRQNRFPSASGRDFIKANIRLWLPICNDDFSSTGSKTFLSCIIITRATRSAQHNTTQHSTAQHSTAQHSTAQHSTAQHSTAQHSTAQHNTL